MARTRSKGLSSPRTPVSAKTKKVGAVKSNLSNASSPSVEKVKKIQIKEQKKKEAEQKETTKAPVAKKATKSTESSEDTLVSQKVAAKAISELTKFLVREQNKPKDTKSNTLFDDVEEDEDSNLYLQINTKKFVSEKPQFKPKLIKLTKSLYNQDSLKTCLIIRDQLVTTTEQIEALENENLPTITQILLLKTLKNEYKNFEKRRQLQSEYDLFIVDDALLNLMPTLLGKIFYGSNKIPLPIRVTSTGNPKEISVVTIKNQLEKCLQSTFFLPPMGVNISIKIGSVNSAFKEDELSQNLQDTLATFEKDTLRSVNLKTTKSPSLPLYYAENLYDEETDVIENIKADEEKEETSGPKLSAFEKGLLELGAPDEVAKIIGKKLNKKNQNKKVAKKAPLKKSKVANKVEKQTKRAKA